MGDGLQFFVDALLGNCRTICKVNAETMMMHIYRFENKPWPTPEIAVDGQEFLEKFLKLGRIDEEDLWQFERLKNLKSIADSCHDDQYVAILVYRRIENGRKFWTRMELMISQHYSPENPELILFNYDMSAKEADFIESCNTMYSQFYKVLKADFTKNEFQLLKEMPSERSMNQRLQRGKFIPGMSYGRDVYVHPDDFPAFRTYMKAEKIISHFEHESAAYQIYYRRRIGSLYRWVKLFVLPASDCTPDNQTYFLYVEDVHREILHVMDVVSGISFTEAYTGETGKIAPIYYENLLEVMGTLIQPYDEFSMIDLEKDLIIHYKVKGSFIQAVMPYVGSYSQSLRNFTANRLMPEDIPKVQAFDTVKKIRDILKDRMTVEYTYTLNNGIKCKTMLRKTESAKGMPTKVLSYSVKIVEENLLKVRTFGNFEVFDAQGKQIRFARKQAKQVLAYLIDKNGFPVTSKDIVEYVLEKPINDINAQKYVSTLVKCAIDSLKAAGYPDVIIKEQKTIRVDTKKIDCDYYNLLNGNEAYWEYYHNEYMKEYSWAEETNAEIMELATR